MQIKKVQTDILIIGGGTAGCYAARTLSVQSDANVLICEKANIERSGCLAAGVNALNAYITPGHTPEEYVEYAYKDAEGIVREDLLLSMANRLNDVTAQLEDLGLVILKDEQGRYMTRGARNLKINGENIKPILARAVYACPHVTVWNHVNVTDLLVEDHRVCGALAFGVWDETVYQISANAVIVATGGAAGIYKPNHPGFSRHKMWYPPFNTGAGYAMGILAGAEMTTLEMRFIALRCKDTIAPTGTLAQGVGAKQVNARGEVYESRYGISTSQRVYGTVQENQQGRGPCALRTKGITQAQEQDLMKAYLNMAPSQTLRWVERDKGPSQENVEIEGTEPYIVGGHTASGYWVDTHRATTIEGLFAAGDVAGGCPQKYVTGALVEGEIAAQSALAYHRAHQPVSIPDTRLTAYQAQIQSYLAPSATLFTTDDLEDAMQTAMDTYAGGIRTQYAYTEAGLKMAEQRIQEIQLLSTHLHAEDFRELERIYELRERLVVCRSLIAHLAARKETRWHTFAEYLDYPDKDETLERVAVNSVLENGEIHILYRDLAKEGQVT